nr:MAG TPA: hypothetical protein [Caudoviricetes sp.]
MYNVVAKAILKAVVTLLLPPLRIVVQSGEHFACKESHRFKSYLSDYNKLG